MMEHEFVMELMSGPEEDLLQPEVGCEVVGNAVEDIRQAVLDSARFVEQQRRLWNPKSRSDFVSVIDELFEVELFQRRSAYSRTLIDELKRLFCLACHLTSDGRRAPIDAEMSPGATVLATGRRACIDIPTSPISLSVDIWPFWLEAMRTRSLDGFPSFESIQEQTQALLSAASSVRARIADSARQVHTTQESIAPEDLEVQIWQHKVLRDAVKFIEMTMARVGRSLLTIQLAMSQSSPRIGEIHGVVNGLRGSVGFRQIGVRLMATLAKRFRAGQFEIKRSELITILGVPRNAFNSAVQALKSQEVVLSSGIGDEQVLWSMPIVCLLADRFSVSASEVPTQATVNQDSVTLTDSLEKTVVLSDSQSTTAPAHASITVTPPPDVSGSIAPERRSSADTQPELLANLEHGRLMAFSNAKSTPGQKRAIEFILAAGGSVPLKDLAVRMDWGDEFKDAWNGFRRRVNQSIQQHNKLSERKRAGVAKVSQGLARCDSRATFVPLELIRQRRKRASMRKTTSSRMS